MTSAAPRPEHIAPDEIADFLRALHLAPHTSFPLGDRIDWRRAPPFLPQALEASIVPLPPAVPPWGTPARDDDWFGWLSAWLATSLMCHRTRLTTDGGVAAGGAALPVVRRALASGGAAYPGDLYLRFGAAWRAVSPLLPGRAWIYLPQYHALAAHSQARDVARPDAVEATLVTVLSRTAFKYREFAYRLSAVDTGVALGRLIHAAGPRAVAAIAAEDDADDLALLAPEEEAAAAIILRFSDPPAVPVAPNGVEAVRLRVEADARSRRAAISGGQPAVFAAMGASAGSARPAVAAKQNPRATLDRVALPPRGAPVTARPLAERVHARRSDVARFAGLPAPVAALATCLDAALRATDPLPGFGEDACLQVGCAIVAVEAMEPLAGLFDPDRNVLAVTHRGSVAALLNRAMLLHAFDIRQCSFVMHVVADIAEPYRRRGTAGYRRSQIAVGAMLDAATLAAVGCGLSAHAFLGFSAAMVGPLYGLDPDGPLQAVAQLCVGYAQPGDGREVAIVG